MICKYTTSNKVHEKLQIWVSTGHESGVYCNPNQSPIDNDRLLCYITTGHNFPKFHYATLKVLAGFRAVCLVKGGYLFLHGITLWGKCLYKSMILQKISNTQCTASSWAFVTTGLLRTVTRITANYSQLLLDRPMRRNRYAVSKKTILHASLRVRAHPWENETD